MILFIVRRAILGVFTCLLISLFAFMLLYHPRTDSVNNYLDMLAGKRASLDESVEQSPQNQVLEDVLTREYAPRSPLTVRYYRWVKSAILLPFPSDSGSYWRARVSDLIRDRLLNTLLLAFLTIIFTWAIAFPIGIYSAVYHHSKMDYAITFVGFLGLAVPDFLLALCLLWVGWAWLGISVGGLFSPEYLETAWSLGRVLDFMKHIWIPALVLGTAGTASLIRIIRNNLLDELRKPYVTAARARGMSEWKIIVKYPVRIALNPFISTIGYLLPFLISGSVIVSWVLSLPTLGTVLIDSIQSNSLSLASMIIFMLGVMTVIGTFLSDILLRLIDPRIEFEK